MGRRFGVTSINRFMSSMRALSAANERSELINQSLSTQKELPITYHLDEVCFDPETRIASIKFHSIKKYRTIERYVTQNYTRYPIYSDWKTKEACINKKIKLSNHNLECLNQHEDSLISDFAPDIILSINNQDLIPSWLSKQIIESDYRHTLKDFNTQISDLKKAFNTRLEESNAAISSLEISKTPHIKKIGKLSKKLARNQKKLSYAQSHEASPILCLISFGIYALLFTQSRKERLTNKIKKYTDEISLYQSEINKIDKDICDIKDKQNHEKTELNKNVAEIKNKIEQLQAQRIEQLKEVKSLEDYVPDSDDFILLKNFIGFEYEKIIGCYVIHNIETDRYYVGQSKDIMKRIKQHFKGTVPANAIFSEDYYKSSYEDKSTIFELKIIKLSTKDELDSTEARLIEKYEANIYGYNSTKGNS